MAPVSLLVSAPGRLVGPELVNAPSLLVTGKPVSEQGHCYFGPSRAGSPTARWSADKSLPVREAGAWLDGRLANEAGAAKRVEL